MRHISVALVFAVCGLTAVPAAAAQGSRCKDTETALACADRLSGPPAAPTDPVKVLDVAPKTETGLSALPNGLTSSMKDFLPLLQLGGVLGSPVSNEKGLVTVAFNPRAGDSFRNLQIRALINSKPTIFQPLKASLDEAVVKKLEADLDKGKNRHDVTIEANVNLTGYRSGRNLQAYRSMVDAFFERAARGIGRESDDLAARTMQAMDKLLAGTGFSKSETQFQQLPPTTRLELEKLAEQLGRANAKGTTQVTESMKSVGLLLLPQMVNNQPQWVATFSKSWRDPLVGPDAVLSGRVSYEKAMGADLKSFLDQVGGYGKCVRASGVDECFKAFTEYVAEAGKAETIKAGLRFSAYVEFTHLQGDYAPTADDKSPLPFTLKKGTVYSGGMDVGRLLDVEEDGKAGGRLDASIRFDYHGKTDSKNRLVASVTVTKKIGDVALPIGLVYANRAAFLSKADYDHGLSVHVGLKFNLFKGLR